MYLQPGRHASEWSGATWGTEGTYRVGPAPLGSGQCVLPRLHLGNVLVCQLICAALQDLVEIVSRVCPPCHHILIDWHSYKGTLPWTQIGSHNPTSVPGTLFGLSHYSPETAQCKQVAQVPGSTLSSTGSKGKRMMLSASTIKMKSSFGSRSCTHFRLKHVRLLSSLHKHHSKAPAFISQQQWLVNEAPPAKP